MTDLSKYADAIFLLAEEESTLETVREDLSTVNTVIENSPEYARILDTPALPKEERLGLIEEAFGGLSEYVKNLLKMLSAAHNAFLFPKLYLAFMKLYNEKLGILEVEAVTAVALSESERAKLSARLREKTGKKISIKNTVDPSILGGVVLRYDSLQLDGSVKTRLEKIEDGLKRVVV